jgi:hypothetical protein
MGRLLLFGGKGGVGIQLSGDSESVEDDEGQRRFKHPDCTANPRYFDGILTIHISF